MSSTIQDFLKNGIQVTDGRRFHGSNEEYKNISDIYQRCISLDRSSAEFTADVSILKNCDKLEKKIQALFARRFDIDLSRDVTKISIDEFQRCGNSIRKLAQSLYAFDDAQAQQYLEECLPGVKAAIYENLCHVVQRASVSIAQGEALFKETSGALCSCLDKYEALLLCLDASRAIDIASMVGDMDRFKLLLSKKPSLSTEDIMRVSVSAASYGQVDIMKYLLSQKSFSEQVNVSQALTFAALQGRIEIIRLLMSHKKLTFPPEAISHAFFACINKECKELFYFFLPYIKSVTPHRLHASLCGLALKNNVDFLQSIFSESKLVSCISDEMLNDALDKAMDAQKYDAAFFLFAKVKIKISRLKLLPLILDAACRGDKAIVKSILSNGKDFAFDAFEAAVQMLLIQGQMHAVAVIIDGYIPNLSVELFVEIMHASMEKGDYFIIELLLSKNWTVEADGVNIAFSNGMKFKIASLAPLLAKAASKGYQKVTEAFFTEGRFIPHEYLYDAVHAAAKASHGDIALFLIGKGGKCSDDDYGRIVALKGDDLQALQFLLRQNRKISHEWIKYSAIRACSKGNYEALKLLLSQGRSIANEDLFEVMKISADQGDTRSLALLCAKDCGASLEESDRGELVVMAASGGHLESVDFLLKTGPIYPAICNMASVVAKGEHAHLIQEKLKKAHTALPQSAYLDIDDEEIMMLASRSDQEKSFAAPAENAPLHRPVYDALQSIETRACNLPMVVSLDGIKAEPICFFQTLLEKKSLPISFILSDSPQTQDVIGVSKEVYYTLFRALVDTNALRIQENGLPVFYQGDERVLDLYRNLGEFYSALLVRNYNMIDPYLTGHVFSADFFAMLKIALINHSSKTKMLLIQKLQHCAGALSPCFALLQAPSDENIKNDVVKIMALREETGDPLVFAEQTYEMFTKPVYALLNGAKESGLRMFLEQIQYNDPRDLCIRIQGKELSRELVMDALTINTRNATEGFMHNVDVLKKHIAIADMDWLKKFVLSISGRSTVAPKAKFIVQPFFREGTVIQFQSCFDTVSLPIERMEEEDFLMAMLLTMEVEGYNIS